MNDHDAGKNGHSEARRATGWNFTVLPDATPRPTTVTAYGLDDLLTQVHKFLSDYIAFPHSEQPVVVSLWIVHTWVIDAFQFTPYLSVGSPTKQCGKSTLLDCLNLLVRRPWLAITPSPAVLYRKIEVDCPTLMIDEVDAIFSAKGDDRKEELRGVLNAGYQRTARVPRCVGPTHVLKEFSVFCPKALAGIGRLPDTVADRSIPITLARKARSHILAKFRYRDVAPRAEALKEAVSAWAQDPTVIPALAAAQPTMPEALSDRSADICEPLAALADLAGGDWPDVARHSFVQLCTGKGHEDDNLPIKLLSACREIFAEEQEERLSSRELLGKLIAREDDAPWAMWWEEDLRKDNFRGPAARLSRLLKPFGVYSKKYRDGTETATGYFLDVFQDAFARYLPSPENKVRTSE